MYQSIILDLDGTLLDTLEDLADSVNHALAQSGHTPRTLDEIRVFVGNGAKLLVAQALPAGTCEDKIGQCLGLFRAHYKENMRNKTQAYKGIYPLLDQLKAAGIRMAVVSNKPDSAVKMLCKDYFGQSIDVAIGDRDGVPKKPAPDSVYEAMETIGAQKESTLYVGDSDVDIQTARNAGLPCVAVTWGFRPAEKLKADCPDFMIDEPSQLLPIALGNAQ